MPPSSLRVRVYRPWGGRYGACCTVIPVRAEPPVGSNNGGDRGSRHPCAWEPPPTCRGAPWACRRHPCVHEATTHFNEPDFIGKPPSLCGRNHPSPFSGTVIPARAEPPAQRGGVYEPVYRHPCGCGATDLVSQGEHRAVPSSLCARRCHQSTSKGGSPPSLCARRTFFCSASPPSLHGKKRGSLTERNA